MAIVLPGCGDDESSAPDGPTISQQITRNYGQEAIGSDDRLRVARGTTVMDALEAQHVVEPTPSGEDVLGIDGLALHGGADETSWILYVNGSEAFGAPAERRLYPGDVIQWDYRLWDINLDVDAIVGAFPQPFASGFGGRPLDVAVHCAPRSSSSCRSVRRKLRALRRGLSTRPRSGRKRSAFLTPRRAEVLVGTWRELRRMRRTLPIDRGTSDSGVFARFSSDGRTLYLLDERGRPAARRGPGTGLVAASQPAIEELLWVITGVDEEGVARAADALDGQVLRNAFAVAVRPDRVERLPVYAR